MSTVDSQSNVVLPHQPGRIGQATAVEQSRAVAEVEAAIIVAQRCPRNINAALQAMEYSCGTRELADRAFFRYTRGGNTISGPSVHLARELARVWGNVQYGVAELLRDDEHGQSEMQAHAWDVQTNTRNVAVFIVPHKRYRKEESGGTVALVDTRDIYENNANAGARRVRECIFAVLPPWFTEKAKALCHQTLSDDGGTPLPKRISDAIAGFAALGVSERQLVAKLGRASVDWGGEDLATLRVIYNSLRRGEVSKDDEFPTDTAADITSAITSRSRANDVPATKPSDTIAAWFDRNAPAPAEVVLSHVAALANRRDLPSLDALTPDETSVVMKLLIGFADTDDPVTALQEATAEWYDRKDSDDGAATT